MRPELWLVATTLSVTFGILLWRLISRHLGAWQSAFGDLPPKVQVHIGEIGACGADGGDAVREEETRIAERLRVGKLIDCSMMLEVLVDHDKAGQDSPPT